MINQVKYMSYLEASTKMPDPDWAVISIEQLICISGQYASTASSLQSGWFSVLQLKVLAEASPFDAQPNESARFHNQRAMLECLDYVRIAAPLIEGILVLCPTGEYFARQVACWICHQYGIQVDQYQVGGGMLYRILAEAIANMPGHDLTTQRRY